MKHAEKNLNVVGDGLNRGGEILILILSSEISGRCDAVLVIFTVNDQCGKINCKSGLE